jgi:hypothetical protein
MTGYRMSRIKGRFITWEGFVWQVIETGSGGKRWWVAHWARKQAAEENTSVSRLVSRMLEEKMRQNDSYWRAYQEWKSDQPLSKTSAANRLSREEVHERK